MLGSLVNSKDTTQSTSTIILVVDQAQEQVSFQKTKPKNLIF